MTSRNKKKRFTITTLGCKVNQYESEQIAQGLKDAGFVLLDPSESTGSGPAGLCIINTCTVTQKASMQSRQAVRQAVRNHPGAVIIVTGCYAQTEPEAIQEIEGVDHIVPHREKGRIPALAASLMDSGAHPGQGRRISRPAHAAACALNTAPSAGTGKTRPFLKIQDGCDAFCTYCIVPYARGASRSMTPKDVLEQLTLYQGGGFHEVVLTGIHLGHYGHDLTPPTTLFDLLRQIKERQSIERLRLSSIEPLELNDDIIRLASEHRGTAGEVCQHFHIPLQSGDNAILNKMNRPYKRNDVRDLILHINKVIPDAGIGCDVLIGFPGETDAAYHNTLQLIRDLPLTYLHVFPFSPREGTPAARFTDRVPVQKIKERCREIRELGWLKRKAFMSGQTGASATVLVENRRDRQTGHLKGIADNYTAVLLAGGDELMNSFQRVNLTGLHDAQTMIGKVKPR